MTEITVMGAGGEYMESVVVVSWHKTVGDRVLKGDLVVTVETAKAATEIEADIEGILTEIRAVEGEEVPLGAVLGIINDGTSQEHLDETKKEPDQEIEANSFSSKKLVSSVDRAFFEKVETGFSPKNATKQETRAVDCVNQNKNRSRVIASPLARRIARQQQIDLSTITPSSSSGRIKARDLESQATAQESLGLIFIQRLGAKGQPRIVFLHGFGSDGTSWNPLLAALGNRFDCILVDLPGHGRSYLPEAGLDIGQIAQAVNQALCQHDLDEFHLVGHSLGGAVALAVVEEAQFSILSLTLLAPAGLGAEINGDFIAGFTRASQKSSLEPWLEKLFANPKHVTPSLIEATHQARQPNALRQAQATMAQRLFPDGTQAVNLRHVLPKLDMPQKIIWGCQDEILPMKQALNVSGKCALHFLDNVGHMPHYEAPLLVAHLLKQNINCACEGED